MRNPWGTPSILAIGKINGKINTKIKNRKKTAFMKLLSLEDDLSEMYFLVKNKSNAIHDGHVHMIQL